MRIICVGGSRDGWIGTILHGRKVVFPVEPKAQYEITDKADSQGRRIALPIQPST